MSNKETPLIVVADAPSARAIEHAAKAAEKGLDIVARTGSYVSEVLGDLPHNLAGIVGDKVRSARRLRAIELDEIYKAKLIERGVTPEHPSLSVSVPLIEAAVDETRAGLKEVWENLLANALDPRRCANVRIELIAALKKLNPTDAEVLAALRARAPYTRVGFVGLPEALNREEAEIGMSIRYLAELGLVYADDHNLRLSEKGLGLVAAVDP